ncbi:MAG: ATP-dependent DNA helicase RecG [Candidatus Omnitrophica bacterium]|nr:ATP-dependent DNA helicase RecG [Candidatus Omnitrophota bacterium]
MMGFMQTEEKSARFVRGIGPKRFEALTRLGIRSIKDLCYFFPRRYEDRAHFQSIGEIQASKDVTIKCQVITLGVRVLKKMNVFEMVVGDPTGIIPAIWFNQPYLKNQFKVGDPIILSGKADVYQGRLQINSPEYEQIQEGETETIHTGRITPIYSLSEGLAQRSLRVAMKEVADHYVSKEIKEYLPEEIRKKHGLMDLLPAIQTMHFPTDLDLLEAARKRIIFDEFFLFELNLLFNMRLVQLKERTTPFRYGRETLGEFKNILPFSLTNGQENAIQEILHDVTSEIPMNRLLQGDVGSGKTVIAAFLLCLVAKNDLQGAFLVPTEILAEQHYQTLERLLKPLGVHLTLLTGSIENEERKKTIQNIAMGKLQIVVGTHALLQEDVEFSRLGLVVIDEQHRFGVRQRAKLILRKPRPHLLVMTATPIPRTLGLTLYGDLDISTIDELPKGRKEIKTYWISQEKETEVLEHIRSQIVEKNDQAYILFPLIEESARFSKQPMAEEQYALSAAKKEYERLRLGIFKKIPIGLIHGKLSKRERDEVMQRFHRGEIKVLVATSVIEVGVDNPNVTFIVIENAERFGLSQLHQMRGRVGRGNKQATCFLFGNPTTEEGKTRLRALTKTQDGFAIAEEDLKLRGPGDLFGTKQSGIPLFQIADLIRDAEILITARKDAKQILDSDSELNQSEHYLLVQEMHYRRQRFQTQ